MIRFLSPEVKYFLAKTAPGKFEITKQVKPILTQLIELALSALRASTTMRASAFNRSWSRILGKSCWMSLAANGAPRSGRDNVSERSSKTRGLRRPMATIKKRRWRSRTGEWSEAWRLRYVDASGTERQKQFARKGDAEAYRIKVGWEVSQGTHTPDSASITVAKAADLWIERARHQKLERSTMKSYEDLWGFARLSSAAFVELMWIFGPQRLPFASGPISGGEIGPPKSQAGHRTIPIPPILVSVLREWMVGAPPSGLGLMFPNSEGAVRFHCNMLNREYWPLQRAAGLCEPTGNLDDEAKAIVRPCYDFHSLRHAAASAWIKQHVDLKRLTTWLGHASVQTTLDVYGHLIRDQRGDAAIVRPPKRSCWPNFGHRSGKTA